MPEGIEYLSQGVRRGVIPLARPTRSSVYLCPHSQNIYIEVSPCINAGRKSVVTEAKSVSKNVQRGLNSEVRAADGLDQHLMPSLPKPVAQLGLPIRFILFRSP